jgi:hypothetical protein
MVVRLTRHRVMAQVLASQPSWNPASSLSIGTTPNPCMPPTS